MMLQSLFNHHYKSYLSLSSCILIGWLTLIIPTISKANEPWQSDPLGMRAYNAYQRIDAAANLDAYKNSTNENGTLAWGESYILMGFMSMYEGTKDTAYLDRLVTHFDTVLSNRDDNRSPQITDYYRGYVMPAWSSTAYTDGHYYAYGAHAGMITHPAAWFAYLVESTPDLHSQYLAKARGYETAIMDTVDAFNSEFHSLSGNEGYYSYIYGRDPYNMQNALGRTIVDLWQATGESKYLDKATRLANYFKNDLTLVGDRYSWRYISNDSTPDDISHAAISVDFAALCYRAGIVFDETDMQRFANTLKYMAVGTDGFTKYVNGSGGLSSSSYRAGAWCHLGYVSQEVRQVLSDYYGVWGSPDSKWATDYVGCSLAAAYLVETSVAGSPPNPPTGGTVVYATSFDSNEGYSPGGLDGQQGWVSTGFYDPNRDEVIDSPRHSGDQALSNGGRTKYSINGSLTGNDVKLTYWFYYTSSVDSYGLDLVDSNGSLNARITFTNDKLYMQDAPHAVFLPADITEEVWYKLTQLFLWDEDSNSYNAYAVFLDDVLVSGVYPIGLEDALVDISEVWTILGGGEVTFDDLSITLIHDNVFLPGDANLDGFVNEWDAKILAENWLKTGVYWRDGDFNDDDLVNDLDATLMAANWSSEGTNVPEPNTVVMLLALGVMLTAKGTRIIGFERWRNIQLSLLVVFLVFALGPFAKADEAPVGFKPGYEMMKPRVSSNAAQTITVVRGETQVIIPWHKSFCPVGNVLRFNNGDLLVWNYCSKCEVSVCKRSSDGGRTWRDVDARFDDTAYQYPDPDGEVVMFSTSPSRRLRKTAQSGVHETGFFRSKDNGLTCAKETAVVEMPAEYDGWDLELCRKIVRRDDGNLLMSLHARRPRDKGQRPDKYRTFVIRSADRGKTWQYLSTVAFDSTPENVQEIVGGKTPRGTGIGFCEPCLLSLPGGKTVCFMRSGTNYRLSISDYSRQTPLYASTSDDGGRSWSDAAPIIPFGVYPDAILMKNGIMAVVYGRPASWLIFSEDGGKTWGPNVPFYHDLYPPDCSNYFSAVEVAADTMLVVYARTDPNDHWQSEIAGTYFMVKRTDK